MDTDQNLNSAESVAQSAVTPDNTTAPDAMEIFSQELPPVTEQSSDYIDEAPESEAETDVATDASAHADDPGTGPESARGTLDKKGGAFDPAIHRYPPELTPGGKWRKRPKSEIDNGVKDEKSGEEIKPNHSVRQEAQKAAALYGGLHLLTFGADGMGTQEQQGMLIDSFENYFQHNGVVEIPPGIDLLLGCGLYSSQIATRPKNMDKIKGFFGRVGAWIKKKGRGKA